MNIKYLFSILFYYLYLSFLYGQSNKLEIALVPGGSFQMGSEVGADDEKPVHRIVLDSFFISKYEITIGQFNIFINETGFIGGKDTKGFYWNQDVSGVQFSAQDYNHPVTRVNWNDAAAFCDWLSKKTKRNYRLPTEAEWEYTAKGGNQGKGYKFSGSNDINEVAWYFNNSSLGTQPVGIKKPNELGIFDMSGNVFEWCSDWYDENYYKKSPLKNPVCGDWGGNTRVCRGGSYAGNDFYCRPGYRFVNGPEYRSQLIGFRVVRTK